MKDEFISLRVLNISCTAEAILDSPSNPTWEKSFGDSPTDGTKIP